MCWNLVAAVDDCYRLSYRNRLIHFGSRKFRIEHFPVLVTRLSHGQHAHSPHTRLRDEVNVRNRNPSCCSRQRSSLTYHQHRHYRHCQVFHRIRR